MPVSIVSHLSNRGRHAGPLVLNTERRSLFSIDNNIQMFIFLNSCRVKERTLFSRSVRAVLTDYATRGISLAQKEKLLKDVETETNIAVT